MDIETAGVVVGIVAVVLTLPALWLGIDQLKKAQAQNRLASSTLEATKELLDGLKDLQRGLATRYHSRFPDFYPAILEALEVAKKEILIACDVPAYGIFSSPIEFLKYREILARKKAQGVRVKIIVQGENQRRWLNENQFRKAFQNLSWDDVIADKTFRDRLHQFEGTHNVQIRSLEQLEDALSLVHRREFNDPAFGTSKHELDTLMPVYVWLVDDGRAVFAIPRWDAGVSEHGFTTIDESLVNALAAIWLRYESFVIEAHEKPGASTLEVPRSS